MENFDFSQYFSRHSFWEHLSETERQKLLSFSRLAHYHSKEAILSGDANCLGVLFILQGSIRIYLLGEDGKQATICSMKEGDVCALSASCMFSAATFDVQIDADSDCDIILVPSAVFSELMEKNIYMEAFIYRLMTEHFSEVLSAVERIFFLSLEQRIAAFLIDKSAETSSLLLPVTQEELAQSIGSAREAVSRSLKQFVKEGSIRLSRGKIEILDKNSLYKKLP